MSEKWVIVEIMGHRVVAGRLAHGEPPYASGVVVELPMPDGSFLTEFYGSAAIFCAREVPEAVARRVETPYHVTQIVREMGRALPAASAPVTERPQAREVLYRAIDERRAEQDTRWGGPDHDDEHGIGDWAGFIRKHMDLAVELTADGGAPSTIRKKLIDVIALGVAAVEAHDRAQDEDIPW